MIIIINKLTQVKSNSFTYLKVLAGIDYCSKQQRRVKQQQEAAVLLPRTSEIK
jgi:hypothetical protein